MKYKKPIDFHLDCNCFLQVQKGLEAQGIRIIGIMMFSDKQGNSGLGIPIVSRLLDSKGARRQGMIHLDFCPFCGKQIAIKPVRIVKDEEDTKPDETP